MEILNARRNARQVNFSSDLQRLEILIEKEGSVNFKKMPVKMWDKKK